MTLKGPTPPRGRSKPPAKVVELDAARVPPHDLAAEAAVLSASILDVEALDVCRAFLKPEHFYSEAHRRIFEAVVDLRVNAKLVDVVQVGTWLRDHGRIEQVGGIPYLTDVINAAGVVKNVGSYARTVHEKWRMRETIAACKRASAEGHLDYGDAQEFIAKLEHELAELRNADPDGESTRALTATSVLDQWSREGRIVHEPTGIVALDERTGGGPIYGTRWLIVGAPDAGKTALLVQIAHAVAARGVCVGLLCVDEEPGDIVTRLAQRSGWSRDDCEKRERDAIDGMREELAKLPIRLYGDEHTVESAAADLATWARKLGKRAMFGCDSIQTISSEWTRTTTRELGPREVVTANMRALRSVATKHRLIALGTSEMSRAGYQNRNAKTEPGNDMASAAESRAVEYLAKVMVALHSVAGGGGDVEMKIAKNKHGPSWRSEEDSLFFSLDRARQTFAPTKPPKSEEDRAEEAVEHGRRDMALVAAMLASRPGVGVKRLKDAMRGRHAPFSDARTAAALEALGRAVVEVPGPRGTKSMTLDGSKVTPEVLALVPLEERAEVTGSRPLTLEGTC